MTRQGVLGVHSLVSHLYASPAPSCWKGETEAQGEHCSLGIISDLAGCKPASLQTTEQSRSLRVSSILRLRSPTFCKQRWRLGLWASNGLQRMRWEMEGD